jgi:predicted small lipoprotein YifL
MARCLWIIAVVTTVGAILAGCGQGAPIPPDDESGEAHQKATEATVEKTEPRASLPKPPNGTLAFESQRETGKLGGYCWDGVCTEATFEVPPGGEALSVPSGSNLLFEYSGTPPPSKVQAKAYALVRGKAERAGEALRVTRVGAKTRIPAEVPRGQSVVELFVKVPGGSMFYYFRIVVDMGTPPTSGDPGRQGPKDR